MYRVNYGNGQVTGSFTLLCVAREYLQKCDGYAYMQRREDNGEYFLCDAETGHFLDMTAPENKDHPSRK